MNSIYRSIKKILKEEFSNDSIALENDKILQVNLNELDAENKTDKIWTNLDILMREQNSDMTKLKIQNLKKLKDLVDHFSSKGKNIPLWLKRKQICNNWKV